MTKVQLNCGAYLVPTAMLDAFVGDAKSASFINRGAAESLRYELQFPASVAQVVGTEFPAENQLPVLDEWVAYLETAIR